MSAGGHAEPGATCAWGHPLRPCAAMAGSCNGCRKLVLDGEQVMDCRACNFYLCGLCLPVAVQDPPLFRGGRRAEAVPPLCVRNTFIDLKEERSPSEERCRRRSQSCPPGQAEPRAEQSPRARAPAPAVQPRAQAFPAGFELPEHLHGAVGYVAEELQEAMNQINEQGLATAVVSNVVAAVELGAAALPAAVVMPATPSSFWPQWAPAQAPAPVQQQAAVAAQAGVWGFFSSIDNAIAGTFDKVADEMKDAAQQIRDQGMARAVKNAVEHTLGGNGRDVLVQVRPPVQPPSPPQQLEEKLRQEEPALGPGELPSRGSNLHSRGSCRPCAFAAQSGPNACKNGYQCQFCHLCEPGEKKRRRKTWQRNRREEKERMEAAAPVADGHVPLRSVQTAPGQLARMGDADEDFKTPGEKAWIPAPCPSWAEEYDGYEIRAPPLLPGTAAADAAEGVWPEAAAAVSAWTSKASEHGPEGGVCEDEEPEVLDWAVASGY